MDDDRRPIDRYAGLILASLGPGSPDLLLKPKDVSQLIYKSEQWLALQRMNGDGIPFLKVGRSILYRKSDLVQWLESRVVASTAEYKAEAHAGPGRKKSKHK